MKSGYLKFLKLKYIFQLKALTLEVSKSSNYIDWEGNSVFFASNELNQGKYASKPTD